MPPVYHYRRVYTTVCQVFAECVLRHLIFSYRFLYWQIGIDHCFMLTRRGDHRPVFLVRTYFPLRVVLKRAQVAVVRVLPVFIAKEKYLLINYPAIVSKIFIADLIYQWQVQPCRCHRSTGIVIRYFIAFKKRCQNAIYHQPLLAFFFEAGFVVGFHFIFQESSEH